MKKGPASFLEDQPLVSNPFYRLAGNTAAI